MAGAGPDFLRFGIPVWGELCDGVAGHQRWGTRWRDHGTSVKRICYGRHWRRSSDLGHPLVRLVREIGWGFLDQRFAGVCTPGPGQPGLPTRLVAGLLILKHMHNLSDEGRGAVRALAG